jgi:dihydrodipicolinate synthase/N-acetylneuraminate lyase
MQYPPLPKNISAILNKGVVIPAHPLALNKNRKLDERRQRALTRYYLDAGAGGIAIGVHTTQFEIRLPEFGLLAPVLSLASEEIDAYVAGSGKSIIKISGVVGKTQQAVAEAELAVRLGYHASLLSLAALPDASNQDLITHCRAVAEVIPLVGFYLQPSVGGRLLDVNFWREFAKIENVVAIKIAPFNRYYMLDVIRGVVESDRAEHIAFYTGNDDNIVADLLTEFALFDGTKTVPKRIVGGLLGHWAIWTKRAVELLNRIHAVNDMKGMAELLSLGTRITDSNAVVFDVAHNYAGCIVGIHEVLRRQGLLEGVWTLNPNEQLLDSQNAEIDRIYASYPELNDDAFVAKNPDRWLR